MIPIQIILISAIVFIAFYMYLRLRSNLVDAILIFGFCSVAVFFVLFPDMTTKLAKLLGVKRGINLVFYSITLFFFFLILKLYSRIRRLENKFTELVRENSLKETEQLTAKGQD
jgi:small membrane protein